MDNEVEKVEFAAGWLRKELSAATEEVKSWPETLKMEFGEDGSQPKPYHENISKA